MVSKARGIFLVRGRPRRRRPRLGGKPPDERAAWHFNDEVLTGAPVHAFAQAGFALLRDQAGSVKLSDEVVEVVVGLEDDIASAPAIAAAGPALGHERLAMKGNAAFAPIAGFRENIDLVNKHKKKGETGNGLAENVAPRISSPPRP